jgi:superfamily II DNA or RNA helicase
MTSDASSEQFFHEYSLDQCRAAGVANQPAEHQRQALIDLDRWYAQHRKGPAGGILALPTGAGKTFTAINFLTRGPLSDDYKILWLAHTHHLLEQAFHGFKGLLGNIREPRSTLRLRVVSGTPGHFRPAQIREDDDVIIATLQTIASAYREDLDALRAFLRTAAAKGLMVVFDEAHHSPAPSYRKLIQGLTEEGAPILGLTATPTYTNESKRGWLKQLFPQDILAKKSVSELIASRVLAKPHFEAVATKITPNFSDAAYQKWLGTYRDLPEDVIEQLAANAERNKFIATQYAANKQRYGKTIVFTDRWFQCDAIVESLRKQGVRADAVYSHVDARLPSVEARRKRDASENARVLERFRKNELDVLVNVRMLTEGTDIPDAQTVFITRQTTSQILLTQMVGRALRGPAFGGTDDAFIVSFTDQWQQQIQWAEYDALEAGRADDSTPVSADRPPLRLISIELVKQLARLLDERVNVASGPYLSNVPIGWYSTSFDSSEEGGDDTECRRQLVLVFEDERAGFADLISKLQQEDLGVFESESVRLADQRERIDALRNQYLPTAARRPADLLNDIFSIVRHVAQARGAPQFFPFAVRADHDLDALANSFSERDCGPRQIQEALRAEYQRKDRFWGSLYNNFGDFRSAYDACQRRLLDQDTPAQKVQPIRTEAPPFTEPDEQIKEQVKRRDGYRCLCCGATKRLEVDHIVPVHLGGPNDLTNLQTLCKVCNNRKAAQKIFFTVQHSTLASAPLELEQFAVPDDPVDPEEWERFLRRTINFTYRCAAVSAVRIGAKGDGYHNWIVELIDGTHLSWLKPLLPSLLAPIQQARLAGNKPPLASLTILEPGSEPLRIEANDLEDSDVESFQATDQNPDEESEEEIGGSKANVEKGDRKARRANAAFMKPMQPDAILAAIIGPDPQPRTEITMKIWAYIKDHGLQDEVEKRNINADAKLLKLFGGKKTVTMFEMTKLVNKHLS